MKIGYIWSSKKYNCDKNCDKKNYDESLINSLSFKLYTIIDSKNISKYYVQGVDNIFNIQILRFENFEKVIFYTVLLI